MLRYLTAFEALSAATRALGIVASVGNLTSMTAAVLKAHRRGELSGGLISVGKALPSVLALTQEFRVICLRQTVGLLFQRAVFAAGVIGAGASFFDMLNQDENTFALTSKMTTELALLALPFSGALAKLMGISAVLPVAGVLVLIAVTGTVFYCLFRDDDEIVFLKNNIWSKRDSHFPYYAALEETEDKKFILNDDEAETANNMRIPSSEIWTNVREIVGEQFSKFLLPHVSICMNEQIIYICTRSLSIYLYGDIDIKIAIQAKCTDMITVYYSHVSPFYEYHDIEIDPIHEERINTEHYIIHEMVFKREDIAAFLQKKPDRQCVGIRCLIRAAKDSIPLEQRSYTVDAGSSWLNSSPELEKRLNSLTEQLIGR